MKFVHILTAILSMLLVSIGLAGEKASTKYTVGITGVVCGSCKQHVREAFSKLEGIDAKSIAFEAGEKEGSQKVTFTSSCGTIKKEDAVKSLGDQAKNYVVVSLEPEKKG